MHYNSSPVAEFSLKQTDNKTFVNYEITTEVEPPAPEVPVVPGVVPPTPVKPEPPKEGIDKEIELQGLKNREKELEVQSKQATMEAIKQRLQLINELRLLGMSNEEIVAEIKKLQ